MSGESPWCARFSDLTNLPPHVDRPLKGGNVSNQVGLENFILGLGSPRIFRQNIPNGIRHLGWLWENWCRDQHLISTVWEMVCYCILTNHQYIGVWIWTTIIRSHATYQEIAIRITPIFEGLWFISVCSSDVLANRVLTSICDVESIVFLNIWCRLFPGEYV